MRGEGERENERGWRERDTEPEGIEKEEARK